MHGCFETPFSADRLTQPITQPNDPSINPADLSAKSPAFAALLKDLEQSGAVAQWGGDGSIGDLTADPTTGNFLAPRSLFKPSEKVVYVGVPSMSAVGRRLAAAAGEGGRLEVLTGVRATALRRDGGGSGGSSGKWLLELEGRAAPAGADDAGAAAARDAAASTDFDCVVTAMSANSTRRLLTGVFEEAAAAAGEIKANVCWSLMVALAKPTGGFDRSNGSGTHNDAFA